MRILLIVLNWVGKGTYWRALHFGKHLAASGHPTTLIVTSRRRRLGIKVQQVEGLTIVESPDLFTGALRSGWDLWNVLNRIAWIRKQSFDIVHTFEARPTALLPALYTQRIQGLPLVMDWADWFGRGGSVEERLNPLIRTILRPVETFFEETFRTWPDATTVICTPLRDKAVALGVPAAQIMLLPNGANTAEIRPQDKIQARQKLGLPANGQIIAYTGAIFRRDAELMAAAFDRLHPQLPQTRLLLIGYCNVAIESMVQAPEAVIRTGPVSYDDLIDYLATCDIGWLPLRDTNANRGRFPMKAHDFMAAGRPFVATDVGDLGLLMRRYAIGRLAADTPESLAEAVLDLLNDPLEQQTSGSEARRVAETEFAWPLISQKLAEFYKTVLVS